MKLIDLTCPGCGASMQANAEMSRVMCHYCGTEMLIDHEVHREEQHIHFENAEDAGYQFEKGRQRAMMEAGAEDAYFTAVSPRSKTVALLLCIFFGYFGVHRFYVGKTTSGLVYLFTAGICVYGWLFDIYLIASGRFTDAEGRVLVR
ncbi:MAG: TM2 domain-containing protein [Lachnospiraceae bacterium]|nr:TM2 domain-containing protein [Lachnospiraceae bacterium]